MLGVALLLQVGAGAGTPPPGWNDNAPEWWHDSSEARAPDPARDGSPADPPPKPRGRYHHVFLGGLGVSAASGRPSDHAELLRQDGYDLGPRLELEGNALGVLFGHLALGAYFGMGARSADNGDAPSLDESVVRVGAATALVLQPSDGLLLLIGPELGVLQGRLSLYGHAKSQTVPEYGGMGAVLWRLNDRAPVWYLGLSTSYTLAPADAPGGVGRDYDYGAFRLGFTVVAGG